MNFSTDRDLLALEPNLFVDVPLVSQQRIQLTDGQLVGTMLSSETADFETLQVSTGAIVLIEGIPCEVVGRTDAQTLEVSAMRTSLADPAIPPAIESSDDLRVTVRTFAMQARATHDHLLALLGIDSDLDAGKPDAAVTEDAIISLGTMAQLEALGTLQRIYSGAVALLGENQTIWDKAAHYHQQYRGELANARVLLDLDGDGFADAERHLGMIQMKRI